MEDRGAINRKMIEDFRADRGKPGGPLGGRPLLLLTTTGAKSGKQRTTPLMAVTIDDRPIVIASNIGAPKHPDWYRNLVAHPQVTVEVGNETFNATAIVAEGEEHAHLWAKIVAKHPFFAEHQEKTARQIPVVILEREKE